ncbi:MAG: VWA domain-containing protein, partial [Ignavibacteria bacterium]
ERERTPLNISVVIDRSGSMGEKNKLEYVKKSVDYIIDELGTDDYISVVTYDDYVDVLQRSGIVSEKYELREKISKLQPGGFTNLSEGMFEGYDQVNKSYMRGYVNRVLLLSDGLANRGITDRYKLAGMVKDKNRRDGITISTFGVGNDFNENLMTDIAEYGKGNYYYIRNSSDIPEIFASELKGIRSLVGQGTKMKVRFPSEYLRLAKVFGYPYELNGNEVVIDFKDFFSEQKKSVLIKFDISGKVNRKLTFENELTYEDVNDNFRIVTEKGTNNIEPAASKDEYSKSRNETVIQNISMFESNEMMENALKEADDGNYEQARVLLQNARGYMDDQLKDVAPSPEMRRQSENIDKYGTDLESAETKSDEEKKEMQKSGKYDNYNTRKKNE